MKSTHIYTEGKTNRQIAQMCMVAFKNIGDAPQGTISNPFELASTKMLDGRTLIQTILDDGGINYNDGWFIVDVDGFCMYVDVTQTALNEMGVADYPIRDNIN